VEVRLEDAGLVEVEYSHYGCADGDYADCEDEGYRIGIYACEAEGANYEEGNSHYLVLVLDSGSRPLGDGGKRGWGGGGSTHEISDDIRATQ